MLDYWRDQWSGKIVENLPRALRLAHEAVVYENSGRRPQKLATISDRNIIQNSLDEARKIDCEIGEAIAAALGIASGRIFRIAKYT